MYSGYLPEQSNQSDWIEAVTLTDEETDELIDISGCRVMLTLRDLKNQQPALWGSTDDGEITLPEAGTFMWTFDVDTMRSLRPGAYEIGVRLSQDDRTVQLIIGSINITDGIDMQ